MFATSSPYRLHHPYYSRDFSHKAGRGLGIRDDKAHGFYNKFTWKVEKLETIFWKMFSPSFHLLFMPQKWQITQVTLV